MGGAVVVSQCRQWVHPDLFSSVLFCRVVLVLFPVLFSQEQLADDCSVVCDPSLVSTGTVRC